MSSPEEFGSIFEKYPPGFKIHLVHSDPMISEGDRSEMDPHQLILLQNFLQRMEDLRIYAASRGITVVEVGDEEGDVYGANVGEYIVTAGCFGDQCVAIHTQYLRDHEINAQRELDLCLIT